MAAWEFTAALQRSGAMRTNLFRDDDFPRLPIGRTRQVSMDRSNLSGGFSHVQQSSGVVEIRSAAQWKAYFDASKETNKLLLIEFTATWCGPCRQMEPVMKEFSANYRDVQFVKIDVDQFEFVARQFQVGTVMPAFVLVKKGAGVDIVSGCKKLELQNKIEKHRM